MIAPPVGALLVWTQVVAAPAQGATSIESDLFQYRRKMAHPFHIVDGRSA